MNHSVTPGREAAIESAVTGACGPDCRLPRCGCSQNEAIPRAAFAAGEAFARRAADPMPVAARKAVAITEGDGWITVVADDGTMWHRDISTVSGWLMLPPLPARTAP